VLLHGLGSRRQIWEPLTSGLAERCEVFAVDLRGFGESPVGASAAMVDQIDAVAEFCAGLGTLRPHLAGNSMGGAIALELGRRGLARSVTTFSPIGFWRTPGRAWCQFGLGASRRLGDRLQARMPDLIRSAALRVAFFGLVFGRPTTLDPQAALADVNALINAPGFEQASASFGGYRFTDPGLLAQIPTTIAWGSRDILLNYALQHRRAEAALPHASHITLHGCGHTPFYDDPLLCTSTVLATVARASGLVDNRPTREGS
jgi:pimeloyl-ACP methyl ester carboxylesterase